jgi:hypothetical protein
MSMPQKEAYHRLWEWAASRPVATGIAIVAAIGGIVKWFYEIQKMRSETRKEKECEKWAPIKTAIIKAMQKNNAQTMGMRDSEIAKETGYELSVIQECLDRMSMESNPKVRCSNGLWFLGERPASKRFN